MNDFYLCLFLRFFDDGFNLFRRFLISILFLSGASFLLFVSIVFDCGFSFSNRFSFLNCNRLFNLLFFNNIAFRLGFHGVSKVSRGLSKLIKSVSNGIVLLSDNTRFLLFKVNSKFIVNERDDHTVMEGDQIRRLVLSNLTERLHEYESSIAGKFVLSLFSNEPSLVGLVSNLGVVSRDSLKFNLDHSLHGATDGVVLLVTGSFQDNFFLDEVLVLIRGDPGGSSTESRWILSIFFTGVIVVRRSQNIER